MMQCISSSCQATTTNFVLKTGTHDSSLSHQPAISSSAPCRLVLLLGNREDLPVKKLRLKEWSFPYTVYCIYIYIIYHYCISQCISILLLWYCLCLMFSFYEPVLLYVSKHMFLYVRILSFIHCFIYSCISLSIYIFVYFADCNLLINSLFESYLSSFWFVYLIYLSNSFSIIFSICLI